MNACFKCDPVKFPRQHVDGIAILVQDGLCLLVPAKERRELRARLVIRQIFSLKIKFLTIHKSTAFRSLFIPG